MKPITIIKSTQDCGAVGHGMQRLTEALNRHGIAWIRARGHYGPLHEGLIFVGTASEPAIYQQAGAQMPDAAESICITKNGPAYLIAGSDERGLAYALYEAAERIDAYGEQAFADWQTQTLSAASKIRGADKFISNSGDESWWMDEDYWRFYLEMLLRARFNRLTLVVGYDTAYFSPPYPFFVDVSGFEDVRVAPNMHVDRAQYLKALRQIGQLCHEYGLDFTFAMWQQIPWQTAQKTVVENLSRERVMDYCAGGVVELLTQCPEIDTLHFRVNNESGVGTQVSAEEYWFRQIDAVAQVNDTVRPIKLELRAKGMTDNMVRHAMERGLDVLVSTKYCCEQAGLPHHLSQMRSQERQNLANLNNSRRYSYADMLKKPRLYRFVYRLWNNGSTSLFTWGDPDYVRRFADSLRLGDADGFEIMAPLSFKGGHELIINNGWPLFDDPAFRFGPYEESRFWLFYRLFGRIGYCPQENSEAWLRPVRQAFGACADALFEAIAQSSRLLPYITGFHFTSHPQLWYWPELSTGAALFVENNYNFVFRDMEKHTYQASLPCDEGLFYSVDDYTQACKTGTFDGRYTPYQCAMWLEEIRHNTEQALAAARQVGLGDDPQTRGVVLDIRMLCLLAQFHIHKLYAAMALSRYQIAADKTFLPLAVEKMRQARGYWAALSELGKAYHSNLLFAVGAHCPRNGTWADYLPEIDADIARIESLMDGAAEVSGALIRGADTTPALWSDNIPQTHPAGQAMDVYLDTHGDKRVQSAPVLRYRHANQLEGEFVRVPMRWADGRWYAQIPAAELSPQWDLMIYFACTDAQGDGLQYPGLWHPAHLQPYHIVKVD